MTPPPRLHAPCHHNSTSALLAANSAKRDIATTPRRRRQRHRAATRPPLRIRAEEAVEEAHGTRTLACAPLLLQPMRRHRRVAGPSPGTCTASHRTNRQGRAPARPHRHGHRAQRPAQARPPPGAATITTPLSRRAAAGHPTLPLLATQGRRCLLLQVANATDAAVTPYPVVEGLDPVTWTSDPPRRRRTAPRRRPTERRPRMAEHAAIADEDLAATFLGAARASE
ncbi:hypothetical protein PVAP13_3NG234326 [Panicum virgatum]|uniref:Uncharacterized protein n=1 Tax=Panicum virgatum TaxID=38727 RepID=A0A8T0U891_PANVG|nr:hypothetical protein PVAP13_3NG234326 [Panicum virgatum]